MNTPTSANPKAPLSTTPSATTSAAAIPFSLRAATLALVFGTAQAQTAPSMPAPAGTDAAKTTESSLPPVKATATAERDNSRASSGGKFEQDVRDVPQSITVVDRKLLDSQAAASLKDALRNVPGITLGAGEGGVIGDNINLRGFSARTDVYLDGMRDRGQYTRDVFALQAVEVLKGPSSMMFGRGSTGGVINQITKKAELKDSGEVGATVGTDGYTRATGDFNKALSGSAAFRVSAFGQQIESTRDVARQKGAGVAPSVRLGIGTPTEFTVAALVQRSRDIPDYGFPFVTTAGEGTVRKPIDAPAHNFYGYTDDQFNQDVNVLTLSLQHKASAATTLRTRLQLSDNRTHARANPLGAVTNVNGTVPTRHDDLNDLVAARSTRERHLKDTSLISQTDVVTTWKTGTVSHQLTAGVELAHERNRDDRYAWNTSVDAATINLGSPVYTGITGSHALSRTTTTNADTVAVYLNDQVELTPQWKLVGGLRNERFMVDSSLVKYTLPNGFPADTTEAAAPKSESMWSPRAGVLFQPDASQSYYLSYGTSFNPSGETVSQSASTAQLAAERNRSFELGAKLDLLDGELSVTGALFRIEKTNPRTQDAAGTQVTEGLIRVDGLELGATGRLSPQWEVFAGYTYLNGKIVESPQIGSNADAGIAAEGKTAPNTPRHNATVWTTYRLTPQWELGGGAQFASERWLNNYETAKVDGYTRWDATVAYLQKTWEVRLNLQNLSDAVYFEASSAGRATPVRGRTALVSALYRF
ncbi:TonB-dependent siderophore receptor [Ideonella sp. DXS29W]|uniref:TonB-dependent siderophore receptor n=1 Tax=Ideonella lacteola TaxID=2984193 RepID=A0ABU9BJ57_9BURK